MTGSPRPAAPPSPAESIPSADRPTAFAAWILAARPRTLPAAAAPVLIGSGLATLKGAFVPLPALAALAGGLLIQVATNLANDYYDFIRGTDTDERIGPLRVTQAGLLAPEQVRRGVWSTLGAALAVGTYLVWVAGWPIVLIGLASLVCSVAYTGGPFPLAYHGLGDLFVFVFFGLVAVGGTVYVQALTLTPDVLWAGAGVGALSTAILVVNNLRDLDTDRTAGKRTLAVRLGKTASRGEYLLLVAFGLAVPPIGVVRFDWPLLAWAVPLVGLMAIPPAWRVLRFQDPAELLPALGQTARVVAAYGLALGGVLAWAA
ncbi:MAG TPA: 1,4-dihydroxy-2-naphthoate polyprenyltransferase [Longimicrobiales bacterium]